jgi:hypothetical protein
MIERPHHSATGRGAAAATAPAPYPSQSNHRSAGRKSMQISARLAVPDRPHPVPCTVMDFSATGARITIDPVIWTARYLSRTDVLNLIMPCDRAEVDCRVVWRDDGQLGLKFKSILRHWRPAHR